MFSIDFFLLFLLINLSNDFEILFLYLWIENVINSSDENLFHKGWMIFFSYSIQGKCHLQILYKQVQNVCSRSFTIFRERFKNLCISEIQIWLTQEIHTKGFKSHFTQSVQLSNVTIINGKKIQQKKKKYIPFE